MTVRLMFVVFGCFVVGYLGVALAFGNEDTSALDASLRFQVVDQFVFSVYTSGWRGDLPIYAKVYEDQKTGVQYVYIPSVGAKTGYFTRLWDK